MFHAALIETELTCIGKIRDIERMSAERERAALQMQRERRRRQSQASAARPDHLPSEMTSGATPSR